MSNLINVRLTKDSPSVEAMDYTAQSLGMSRNEMILKAVTMMINFDKVFYNKLEAYSRKVKVPMWVALQNMIIKRWAQDAAKSAVWGTNPEILIEFSNTEDGIISPKELYEMAYKRAFDAEARERIALQEKEIAAGLPPRTEEAKAFYEKYRYKYNHVPSERNEDADSFAYWVGEMSHEEALEKFKGGKSNAKDK